MLWDATKDPFAEVANALYGDAGTIDYRAGDQVREALGAENIFDPATGAYLQSLARLPMERGGPADTGLGLQARGQEQMATRLQQQAAMGMAPSAAEIQQAEGIRQGMRQQLALANTARGGTGAQLGALRGAREQAALMGLQGAQQGAALRAQEMAGARGAYSQATQAGRAGDLGVDVMRGDQFLRGREMDDALRLGLGGLGVEQAGVALGASQQQLDRDLGMAQIDAQIAQANAEAEMERRGGIFKAIGALFGAGS